LLALKCETSIQVKRSCRPDTTMYFGLVFMQPDGLSSAIAVYGVPLFCFSQAMRIAGCVTGAIHDQRRAELRLQAGSAAKEPV
jgi:hypothetical protein